MSGPLRCVVFAGLLVAACGDDTSMPGTDAATGSGLVVAWSTQPATWPIDLGDGLTLEQAMFACDRVRVVGDAAPGDPRTTASGFELLWDDVRRPAELSFPDAPGGLYSQLSLLVDGHVAGPSIVLRGHARVGGTDYEYRITDDSPVSATLAIDKTHRPPATTGIVLRIDFETTLRALDFSTVRNSAGVLELDNADPQISTFRAKLVETLTVAP
jgi:hypothetical protein